MSVEMPLPKRNFKTGGALEPDSLYVERPADQDLFAALREGEFCYVLAPRQIGKSSLRARTARRLEAEDIRCVSVELTVGKSTEEQWYYGLVRRIWSNLALEGDEREFWTGQKLLAPTERFLLFLSEIVLKQIEQPLVIFIDEIETTLELPFRRDDFFATIRSLYNARADQSEFHRLTFCLLGVITPGDLIENPARTPFNIGRGIRLEDFTRPQMEALLPGLQGLGVSPQSLLDAIYDWTSGHPYMTLNLCSKLAQQGAGEVPAAERIAPIIQRLFLERGRSEDSNLAATDEFFTQKERPSKLAGGGTKGATDNGTGSDKAVAATETAEAEALPWYMRHRAAMLQLYRSLLEGNSEPAKGGDPVQMALRLTGIAAERGTGENRSLQVRNRIFAAVFDVVWLKEQESGRLIADALADWMNANRAEDYLLHGERLAEASKWADAQTELTKAERQFLEASQDAERRKEKQQADAARQQAEAEREIAQIAQKRAEEQTEAAREKEETARQRAEEKAKNAALFRRITAVLACVSLIALVAMYIAIQNGKEAKANEDEAKRNLKTAKENEQKANANEAEARKQAGIAAQKAHTAKLSADRAARSALTAIKAKRQAKQAEQQALKAKLVAIKALNQAEVLRAKAQQREAEARSGVFAAQSLLRPNTEKSLQLALAAVDAVRPPTPLATQALREALSYGRLFKKLEDVVTSVAFSPNGKLIVTGNGNKTAKVWNAETSQEIRTLKGHDAFVHSVSFSPNGKQIVTGSYDNTAKVWSVDTGQEQRTFKGHTAAVNSVAFSPNGKQIVTGSYDNTAKVWNVETGQEMRTLKGQSGSVDTVAFSPNGKQIVTGSVYGVAKIWSAETGQELRTLKGETSVTSAAFSPNGKLIVTGHYIGKATVWNADTGQKLKTLEGSFMNFELVAFSPDGKQIVTGGQDDIALVWNAETGKELGALKGHSETFNLSITSVAFSPDGKHIVTGSSDKTLRIYDRAAWEGSPAILEAAALRQLHGQRLKPAKLDEIVKVGVQDLPAPVPPRQQPSSNAPNEKTSKYISPNAQRPPEKVFKK